MKRKIQIIMMLAAVAVLPLAFVGCSDDEDDEIGYSLAGTWEGYVDIWHEFGGVAYESTHTVISFDSDPYQYDNGTGYWIDYYENYRWGHSYDYTANHIEWRVDGQVIRIYFVEEDTYLEIHDYGLTDNHFAGTIYYNDNTTAQFSFTHTSSPNWSDYDFGFYTDYYSKPNTTLNAPKPPLRSASLMSVSGTQLNK